MYDRKKIRSAQNVTDVSFFCSDSLYDIYVHGVHILLMLVSNVTYA